MYVGANRPEISTEEEELVFGSCAVTRQVLECFYCQVDDIKSPCRNPERVQEMASSLLLLSTLAYNVPAAAR